MSLVCVCVCVEWWGQFASPPHRVNCVLVSWLLISGCGAEVRGLPSGPGQVREMMPISPDMVPWVLAEGFGVPYPRERSEEHRHRKRGGGGEEREGVDGEV